MIKDIHNQIKIEYERRRKAAIDTRFEHENEIYAKVPEIAELDNKIRSLGVKYNKRILLGGHEKPGDMLYQLDCLREEKKRLLKENGYPENYLETKYQCEKCGDTGYTETEKGSEKCSCYRQQLLDYTFSRSNLKITQIENFSTFDFDYYPNTVDESKYGINISPRENIALIRGKCQQFVNEFERPDEGGLFFSGPTGTGKTFMINCIAMELVKKGVTILYQSAPSLFDIISNHRQSSFRDNYDSREYDYISDVDLLIIDDLGTESPSAARYAELLTILNKRQTNNLVKPCKTIISTNIGLKMLREYYDERIISRIIGCFYIARFAGEDIRTLKKLSKKA